PSMDLVLGRYRLEIISFRVAENDVASYEKHGRRCRASDSFRASICRQAKTERERAAKRNKTHRKFSRLAARGKDLSRERSGTISNAAYRSTGHSIAPSAA